MAQALLARRLLASDRHVAPALRLSGGGGGRPASDLTSEPQPARTVCLDASGARGGAEGVSAKRNGRGLSLAEVFLVNVCRVKLIAENKDGKWKQTFPRRLQLMVEQHKQTLQSANRPKRQGSVKI